VKLILNLPCYLPKSFLDLGLITDFISKLRSTDKKPVSARGRAFYELVNNS
jgi:hypothetical protein